MGTLFVNDINTAYYAVPMPGGTEPGRTRRTPDRFWVFTDLGVSAATLMATPPIPQFIK
jgi:hypothetical protein